MRTVLALTAAAAALFLLDRLALRAEAKGWIYWRRRKPSGSTGADLLLDVNLFDPGARHVVEVREAEPTEEISNDDILPPRDQR